MPECTHANQVPVRLIGDKPKAPNAWSETFWYFWMGFCPDCKVEVLNRYKSTTLIGFKFKEEFKG